MTDDAVPKKSDDVYHDFFTHWYGIVAKAMKENPNAAKATNVRTNYKLTRSNPD